MTQLNHSDFIHTKYLTEAAYSVVNALWPRIEEYIESKGGVKQYLLSLSHGKNVFNDGVLQKVLYFHFNQLLEPTGFYLKELNLVYEKHNSESYGSSNAMLMISQKGTATIPVVMFDIIISNMFTMTENQVLETLFHELTHLEQSTVLLLELTADKLIETVPINKPLFIDRLEQYFEDRNQDVINDGEIEAYSRELALKVFNINKLQFKSMSKEARIIFVNKNVLSHISEYMSPAVKEHIFNELSDNSRHIFLRLFLSQLKTLCNGLL